MKRIAWRAVANVYLGFARRKSHGEVEVPDTATPEEIKAAIGEQIVQSYDITYKVIS